MKTLKGAAELEVVTPVTAAKPAQNAKTRFDIKTSLMPHQCPMEARPISNSGAKRSRHCVLAPLPQSPAARSIIESCHTATQPDRTDRILAAPKLDWPGVAANPRVQV